MTSAVINNIVSTKGSKKVAFSISHRDWLYSLFFLLSMSLFGLHFPLGYLLIPVLLINSLVRNRYDFLIQFILFTVGYGFIDTSSMPFKFEDILLLLSFVSIIIVRKRQKELKRATVAILVYIAILLAFALMSEESLSIQVRIMRRYMFIVTIYFPLLVFANREFDLMYFFRRIIGYSILICALYAIDCYILNGFLLIPGLKKWGFEGFYSYLTVILRPLSMDFPRHYPQGAYLLALAIYPLCRYYKLSALQWTILLLGIASTRTMSFFTGLLVTYIIFIGRGKDLVKYGIGGIVLLTSLYFVDGSTGGNLRVKSTVDQFIALDAARDEEDLSEFGTGRMAQIIPKFTLLSEEHRVMTGFGFLHPELTTISKYQIVNPLYIDQSKAEEVATGVEVTQAQTILDIGVIGLIIQTLFYIYLFYIIRDFNDSKYYLSVLLAISIFGIGGFAGLSQTDGVTLVALSFSVIFLSRTHIKSD